MLTFEAKVSAAAVLLSLVMAATLASFELFPAGVVMHNLAQAWVLVTSSAAVTMVARTDSWHRWGYVMGFASEPGWLYSATMASPIQWAVVLLTVWWAYYWGIGAWRRFRKSET